MDPIGWFEAAAADGLVLLAFGGVAICQGAAILRAGHGWPFAMRSLGAKLVAWNAAPAGRAADLERQIRMYFRTLGATTAIATGATAVLAGLALALAARGGHLASPEPGAAYQWSVWLLYVVQLVGAGLGYPLAVRVARRSGHAGPRYADLRRRRLADYRAPGLRWLAPAAVAVQAAAAVALFALQRTWTPMVLPALAALIIVLAELQMWTTARAPRMVVTADPATARRCDDLVRAGVVARLQCMLLLSVGTAALFEEYLAIDTPRPRSAAVQVALLAFVLCGAACIIGAAALRGLEERLGGTITGWWGRPMPE